MKYCSCLNDGNMCRTVALLQARVSFLHGMFGILSSGIVWSPDTECVHSILEHSPADPQ